MYDERLNDKMNDTKPDVAASAVKRLVSACHDCGAKPGELHEKGCDVERCLECGGQRISCDCTVEHYPRIPWTGEWPGVAECRAFGWYSKMVRGRGWVRCDKDDPEATEDLNRLCVEAVWDKEEKRYLAC